VCKIDDHLDFELFPGESVFDELWARSTYGGTMPSTFRIGIRGEGETWQNSIVWDTRKHPKLPIMSATFSVNHSLPPHPMFPPVLEDEKGEA
jgi:hypothetical protein